jgi:two-component system, LytTR family, sensor kinase
MKMRLHARQRHEPLWRTLSWDTWTIVVALASLLGLLESVQFHIGSLLIGTPIALSRAIIRILPFWLLVGIIAPPVISLARQFRPARYEFWSRVPIQVVTALVLAFMLLAGRALLDPLGPRPPGVLRQSAWNLLQTYFVVDVLALVGLVGLLDALYYYREARAQEVAASRLQANLAEARLQMLVAQFEPHFLFNTLNAISVLALENRNKAVVEMLGRLSELLRVVLDGNRPAEVPLEMEMQFITDYLEIQRIRFSDRLTLVKDVAPEVAPALVPSMILQPLVENAVVHGIAQRRGGGCVTVRASRQEDVLLLEISDTGPGFGGAAENGRARGLGLATTRARLEFLYGSRQRLDCADLPEGGASVRLVVPFRIAPSATHPDEQVSAAFNKSTLSIT